MKKNTFEVWKQSAEYFFSQSSHNSPMKMFEEKSSAGLTQVNRKRTEPENKSSFPKN